MRKKNRPIWAVVLCIMLLSFTLVILLVVSFPGYHSAFGKSLGMRLPHYDHSLNGSNLAMLTIPCCEYLVVTVRSRSLLSLLVHLLSALGQ